VFHGLSASDVDVQVSPENVQLQLVTEQPDEQWLSNAGPRWEEVLVSHDAQQLAHVRQPPIGVAREVHCVERRHVPRERVGPRVHVVPIVDGPVGRELLPHEPVFTSVTVPSPLSR